MTILLNYCIVLYFNDSLVCLYIASITCAHVKSELWTWTLRSLCPYQPRLFFSNSKVTAVIYLGKLLTFSHKNYPPYCILFFSISLCHMSYHMFYPYVIETRETSICKTIQNPWPGVKLETSCYFKYTIQQKYISLFWDKLI